MAPTKYCGRRAVCSPSSSASSRMQDIGSRRWRRSLPKQIVKRSDAHHFVIQSHALAATVVWRATSSATQNRRRLRSPRHDPHYAQTLDETKSLLVNLNFLELVLSVPGMNIILALAIAPVRAQPAEPRDVAQPATR